MEAKHNLCNYVFYINQQKYYDISKPKCVSECVSDFEITKNKKAPTGCKCFYFKSFEVLPDLPRILFGANRGPSEIYFLGFQPNVGSL